MYLFINNNDNKTLKVTLMPFFMIVYTSVYEGIEFMKNHFLQMKQDEINK